MQISPCACHHLAMLCCCSLPAMEVYIAQSFQWCSVYVHGACMPIGLAHTVPGNIPCPSHGSMSIAQYAMPRTLQYPPSHGGYTSYKIYCSVTQHLAISSPSYVSINWHLQHLHYCKHAPVPAVAAHWT